ncbi:tripartite tricarboxylate transporter TctB family protein [Ilyobacter polytropus]|uniref:DUF1468 domain-containing protein n=1 Tax=Ilyobacter polytropus (strain ATCC 51220 / DSM 2926 / LMG 16218 / CuHBu1) TaxID=572544 RepID=E3HC64_ILYPC|nr:tripartite tricarboxylate transporter TctB family protein [Ilyobacter polytropus]ADO83907.1 hypothetical protein Ilyop_2143 [Ilyobacter polytropus DSM 2926]
MKKINIVTGIIFIIFSIFIFIQAIGFKQTLIVDAGLGAGFFPKLIAAATIILSVLLIISAVKDESLTSKVSDVFNSDIKKPLLGMVLILAYGFSIMVFGYLISTIVFCYIFLQIFRVKKLITKIAVSVIFSFVIYFIFGTVFLISLPTGLLM